MRRTGAGVDLLEREAADSGSGVRLECVVLRSRRESDEALRLQGVSQSDVRSAGRMLISATAWTAGLPIQTGSSQSPAWAMSAS